MTTTTQTANANTTSDTNFFQRNWKALAIGTAVLAATGAVAYYVLKGEPEAAAEAAEAVAEAAASFVK